jgi:hypothetical protein
MPVGNANERRKGLYWLSTFVTTMVDEAGFWLLVTGSQVFYA